MESIAATKVLFLNSNALSKSFIRYHHHHHHHHHRFVCYLQSRGNQQLKLVTTSKETHIVKPILMKAPEPKPKPKPRNKVVEDLVFGVFLIAVVGTGWIYSVTLPKVYDNMISDSTEISNSAFNSVVASAYTSGEAECMVVVMLFFTLKLIIIHEIESKRNRKSKSAAFKLAAGIILCVFVGCSLQLLSVAHVRDTWLSTRGHAPWHLILVVFFIVWNISAAVGCALVDIRNLEDRVNAKICVGSGTRVGDLKSRKRSRRPRKKFRRRGIIVLSKHLGRVSGLGGQ